MLLPCRWLETDETRHCKTPLLPEEVPHALAAFSCFISFYSMLLPCCWLGTEETRDGKTPLPPLLVSVPLRLLIFHSVLLHCRWLGTEEPAPKRMTPSPLLVSVSHAGKSLSCEHVHA